MDVLVESRLECSNSRLTFESTIAARERVRLCLLLLLCCRSLSWSSMLLLLLALLSNTDDGALRGEGAVLAAASSDVR